MSLSRTEFGVGGEQAETEDQREAAAAAGKAASAVIGTRAMGQRINAVMVTSIPLVEDYQCGHDMTHVRSLFQNVSGNLDRQLRSISPKFETCAARVSIGDAVSELPERDNPVIRDEYGNITVTIQLYYVVGSTGVTREDVKNLTDELDRLYDSQENDKLFSPSMSQFVKGSQNVFPE